MPTAPPALDANLTSPDDAYAYLAPGVTIEMAKVVTLHAHLVLNRPGATVEGEALRLAADLADDRVVVPIVALAQLRTEIAAAQTAAMDVTEVVDVDGEPADPVAFDMGLVRRFKDLHAVTSAAVKEAAALKQELALVEAEMVQMYRDNEVPSMSVDGKTLSLSRQTFAQRRPGVTADDVKAALRAAGYPELVTETINANTLSAFVREFFDPTNPKPFPEALAEVLELGERIGIGVVNAGKRGSTSTA